jgi:hypothetical protein
MSRGVVLWPDTATAAHVRQLWDALRERGLSSLATHSHRRHQPHCSLSVAEEPARLAVHPWPYFEVDAWVPHITLSMAMTPGEPATAIPLVIERLPMAGTFDRGGVEDGTTGEHWPAPSPSVAP